MWVPAVELFVTVVQSSAAAFAERSQSVMTSIDINLVWTDLVDSIEAFLLAKPPAKVRVILDTPLLTVQGKISQMELDKEHRWLSNLCDLLGRLVVHASALAPIQQRLLGLLIDSTAALTLASDSNEDFEGLEALSRSASSSCFRLCEYTRTAHLLRRLISPPSS